MDKFYKTNLKLVSQKNKKKLPNLKQFKYLSLFLNSKEKIFIRILIALIIICSGYFLYRGYENIDSVPTYGGNYTEGIIGQIQYLNPLLSLSNDVDSDIDKLIYNSLFEYNKRVLTPSLVKSYTISEDQKTYTFKLKDNIYWHDGVKLTSDDIIYTIKTAQDPNFKSPLYVTFKDVKSEKIDDLTFTFTLSDIYSPFLDSLTFGILPKHIWQDISYTQFPLSEYNLKPVGTGPYKFKTLSKSKEGFIKSYTLESNDNYFKKKPYIKELTFKFLSDTQEAIETIQDKKINGVSFLNQDELKELSGKNITVNNFSLPQYTALFFNSSLNPLLKDSYIRKTLTIGTNKNEIIKNTFDNNAEKVETIFFKNMTGYDSAFEDYSFNPTNAVELLESNNWQRDEKTGIMTKEGQKLEFTLTTVSTDNSKLVAEEIQKQWERLGIKLNIQYIDQDSIKEDALKPRNYEILLYGEILGGSSDPFSFWHSSQIKNPGLNLALYNNKEVDQAIEKARKTNDKEEIQDLYKFIQGKIKDDMPAIFLFNQYYNYVTTKDVNVINDKEITTPSDRFNNIENWFIKTKKKLF